MLMQRKYMLSGLAVIVAIAVFAFTKFYSSRDYVLPELAAEATGPARAVFLANGIKIGEVGSDSAIVWSRLTRDPATEPEIKWGHLVSGTAGEVRITYWPSDNPDQRTETDWVAVDTERDFTRQTVLSNLTPATEYALQVEGRSQENAAEIARLEGRFSTAPDDEDVARVLFSVVTGQGYHRRDDDKNGHTIYQTLMPLDVDFFVHTGDNVYYDKPGPRATSIALARFKWNRVYSMPFQRAFFNNSAAYFMKDDHDTLKNDSWPGQTYGDLTWEQGLAVFREQVPMGEKTHRTFRWGRDLQIWLVEGRDFRSANDAPDGPDKTILGAAQKRWLYDSVRNSNATFRVLITPTPILGPDRSSKNDNHANAGFKTEGDELREFISEQENMYIVTGDRHWQYFSEDPETGLMEFSSGPTTDKHANGFDESDRTPMQKYLNLKGGFLTVEVVRQGDDPRIIFRHHAVDGSVYNEETLRH
jgi:alkaline phosphatase D